MDLRLAERPRNQDGADDQHRHRQQHAHGEMAPEEAELLVRLAEQFADNAGNTIEADEAAEDQARPLQRAEPDHGYQHDEQYDAFETGLIKLARMARQVGRIAR